MKQAQISIFALIAIVALIALDLAAIRFLMDYDSESLLGIALSGPVLQIGAFLAVWSRNRARAF